MTLIPEIDLSNAPSDPEFVLDMLIDNMDDWHTLDELADQYRVDFDVVAKWAHRADMNAYEHVKQTRDHEVLYYIHSVSWEQLCEDFWFRNVSSRVI